MTAGYKVVLDGDVRLHIPIDGQAGIVTVVHEYDQDVYTGDTEVTPTQATQTLETANKIVLENIVVNPIPSNYGLITWDGVTLTVS